ncbi:tyrosine-type recombinase/integrase [Haloplanus salilacus]|uniref:tyrosine-type recombinase/integrase n=1 Tax=Haloplanus salilacus TaxID=2949994 RepID=UPI0030D5C560
MATSTKSYRVRIGGVADGGNPTPDLSPRAAFERWLGRLRASKADLTVSGYHYQLKLFIEFCEQEGITSIDDLSGWDIDTYETHRRKKGVELNSLSKELGTLKRFLEYCARIEVVDESLPEKVDPPDVPRDAQVDETRLEPHRASALLSYYDEHAYGTRPHALLTLAWYVGARLGALRGLDIDDYDSDEAYLEFIHRPREDTPLKNGADGERAVGLSREVCDVLDAYLEGERHENYDDYGRRPLFTSEVGRGSRSAIRSWTYLATVPCLHTECPHGHDPETCEYLDYSKSSQCPSSRSPHQVRTGSITWQLNRGVPIEAVAERVNTSVRTLKRHYDQPTKREELEERRREHVDKLGFDEDEDDQDAVGENGGEQE